MKPLTSFIQGISIVTSEMSDAVFYETKLCLTYILIFLTFLPRVKLQSQQTNNGFKSKNGIIRATVGYLSGVFFTIYLFLEGGGGGCSTNFVSDGPRFFFCVVDQFLLLKKQLNRESSNILSVVRRSSFRHFNCS